MIDRLRLRLGAEDGQVLILVLSLITLMTALAAVFIDVTNAGQTRSQHSIVQQTAYQAAEAGINDYTSKMVEDSLYYSHLVHPGESTRKATNGTLVAAGGTWTYSLSWTYPNGHDTWRSLPEPNPTDASPSIKAVGLRDTRLTAPPRVLAP